MNREEFQTERTRIISEMLDNPDEYGIYPTTKCFEQLDALFDSLSLPPAEGAEEILLRQRNGEDKPITYAVGKGGWVYKMILRAMTEFATLHAQRIAEKMVSEKYDELLQQRDELKEALINMMVVVRDCYPLLFDNEKPTVKQAEAAIKNTEKR